MSIASTAGAAPPSTITDQGRLFDQMQQPITGTQTIVFSLYTAASGSSPVWTESHNVTLDQGYFSVQLGTTSSFLPAGGPIFDGTPLFLGITVGTDAEMSPRSAVASVPYALNAGDVTGDINPQDIERINEARVGQEDPLQEDTSRLALPNAEEI